MRVRAVEWDALVDSALEMLKGLTQTLQSNDKDMVESHDAQVCTRSTNLIHR